MSPEDDLLSDEASGSKGAALVRGIFRLLLSLQEETAAIKTQLGNLVALEREHAHTRAGLDRAFGQLEKQTNENDKAHESFDARLKVLESQAPLHDLVRKLVVAVVWTVIAAIIVAGLSIVVPNIADRRTEIHGK